MRGIILCIFLLISSVENRKLNSGAGRGSSGARGNPSHGKNKPTPGGSSGYRPQPAPGGSSGYRPQPGGGYQPHPGGAHQPHPGSGYQPGGQPQPQKPAPKGSSNTFKKALLGGALGAAGGIAAYELGKAILHSPSKPLEVNGQPYYFGEQNYQRKSGYFMCSVPLDEVVKQIQANSQSITPVPAPMTDASGNTVLPLQPTTFSPEQFFQSVQFKDGTRPRSLTWSCKTGAEVCCGTECCPAQQLAATGNAATVSKSHGVSWLVILFSVLGGLALLACCCCCIAYKLCRSVFDSCLPSNDNNQYGANVSYSDHSAAPYPSATGIISGHGDQSASAPPSYPPAQGYNYPSQPYAQQYYPPPAHQQQQYY